MKKSWRILSAISIISIPFPIVAASCEKKNNIQKTIKFDENNQQENKEKEDEQKNQNQQDNQSNKIGNKSNLETNKEDLQAKEKQENLEKIKKIQSLWEMHKDEFGTFHTHKDVLDQINVYANEEKISTLELANDAKINSFLEEDENGGKNNIEFKIGENKFNLKLGSVFKDKVVTKYYLENNPNKIIISKDGKFEEPKNSNENIVITQIGYMKSKDKILISKFPKKTTLVPKHLPLKIESLTYAFSKLEVKEVKNIEHWNTKNITDINHIFSDSPFFNQDISNWDTKNIKNMSGAFFGATSFNQPLNSWDVSNVTLMSDMFSGATKFNQDLSNWKTNNVVDMESMFQEAKAFNGDIANWNVEKVKRMGQMFTDATSFNKNIGNWRVMKDVAVFAMFKGAEKFNLSYISNWNTKNKNFT
ncbi:BspA family leucine-rich repeat surface protein [Metamycoplasma alkalescens]|nr:BspA family leucine-rich repeat surface protein [Metamycoplasma alkalescens]